MELLNQLDLGTIATLLTVGLTVATTFFGTQWKKYVKVVREIVRAVKDDNISKEELKKIVEKIENL